MPKILDAQAEEVAAGGHKPPEINDFIDEKKNGQPPAHPRFQDSETFIGHYHEGKKIRTEVRRALRGEPRPPTEEYWITRLTEILNAYKRGSLDLQAHKWGFVCYRLTYDQTETEWADFKRKFEADVFRSGE